MDNELINLNKRISALTEELQELKAKALQLEIDSQNYVKCDKMIKPGTGCRVSYNKYGTITSSEDLTVADIPPIPIDKVINLRDELANICANGSSEIGHSDIPKPIIEPGVGFKVTYNEYGAITKSESKLAADDIPTIPIEKVDSLIERINSIEESLQEEKIEDSYNVPPGVGIKLSYDSKGRITGSESMMVDDLPQNFVKKVNTIESNMTSYVPLATFRHSADVINDSIKQLSDKLNTWIDEGGMVATAGPVLPFGDDGDNSSPSIGVNELNEMKDMISSKVSMEDFVSLTNEVRSVKSRLDTLIMKIDSYGNDRVQTVEDVANINNEMIRFRRTMNYLVTNFDVEAKIRDLIIQLKRLKEKVK